MALPKNKGIKKVTVGETDYYWTVKQDQQAQKLVVGIGLVNATNEHVTFLVDHEDTWLAFPRKTENQLKAVTPNLIRAAIRYAIGSDEVAWNGKRESVFIYRDGKFGLDRE